MTLQIANLKTTKLTTVMRRKAFVDGFKSVREGKPLNYDYSQFMRDQWDYERGRILATVYDGKLKDGHTVNWSAIRACEQAFREHVIF